MKIVRQVIDMTCKNEKNQRGKWMDLNINKGENSGHKFTDWKKTGNAQNKKTKKQL